MYRDINDPRDPWAWRNQWTGQARTDYAELWVVVTISVGLLILAGLAILPLCIHTYCRRACPCQCLDSLVSGRACESSEKLKARSEVDYLVQMVHPQRNTHRGGCSQQKLNHDWWAEDLEVGLQEMRRHLVRCRVVSLGIDSVRVNLLCQRRSWCSFFDGFLRVLHEMGRKRTLKNVEKAKAKAANRIKTRISTNNIQIPTTSFNNPAFDPSSSSTLTRPSLAPQNPGLIIDPRQLHKSSMYARKAGKSCRKSIISKQNHSGIGKTRSKLTNSIRKPSNCSSSSSSHRRYINVPRIRI